MERRISRSALAIVVLVVLLASAGVYILTDTMQEQSTAQMQAAFQQGFAQGRDYAVTTIFAQTNNCQAYGLRVGNQTKQIVDTACLQQAAQ